MNRVLILILTTLFTTTYAWSQSPTAPAKDFNIFVYNDAILKLSEADGGVAVGENLILDNVSFQVNNQNKSTFDIRGSKVGLLVNRRLIFNSGNVLKVNNGIVKVGDITGSKVWYKDQNNATPPTRITRSTDGFDGTPRVELAIAQQEGNPVNEAGLIDFAAAFQTMRAKSADMGACQPNTSLSSNPDGGGSVPNTGGFGSQLYYTLQTGKTNIINIKGSDLNNVNVFAPINNGLKPSAASPLVINVDAPGNFTWQVPNFSTLGINEAAYIIINFYNSSSVDIAGSASVEGTIFAPNADVTKITNSANIEGQVIADSFISGAGEVHSANFTSIIPTCKLCTVGVTAEGDNACLGDIIILIADGTEDVASYKWAGPLGFTSNLQTPNLDNATAGMAGVYTVTVTSTAGASCTSTATASVVIDIINPGLPPNITVLEGEMLELSATGGDKFEWSGPANFTSKLQDPMRFANASIAGVYTVTVTGITGCTATATTSVRVQKPCNVLVTANATTVCAGGTIEFSGSGTDIATYAWSGPGNFSSTLQNPTRPLATSAMAGGYFLSVTGTAGSSCTASTSLSVIVNPIIAGLTSNSPVAAGQTLNLSASGGFTYQWSGPNAFTSTTRFPSISNVTTAASGVYSATITGDPGCTAFVSTTVSITSPLCNVSVAPKATTVCVGGTIDFSANATNATVYTWSGSSAFSSTLQNPNRVSATAAMAGVYSVTAYQSIGSTCSNSATLSVSVNPIIAGVTSNSPVAAGQTLNLSASGGFTYAWSGPNAFTSTTRFPSISNVTTAASGVYSATITGDPGCTAFVSTTVNVNSSCNLSVKPTANNVCIGGTLQFSANAPNAGAYNWDGPGLFSSDIQNPSRDNAVAAMTGTYSVTVTSTAGASCTASTTLKVVVNPIVASVSSNSPIIAGGTLNLSASPGLSYVWSGPDGFTSTVRNPTRANTTVAMAGVYEVQINGDPGCTAFLSTTVNITPPCVISVAPTAKAICVGGTIEILANGKDAISHAWRGPSGFISSLTDPIRLNATTAFGGVYSVIATGSAGASCTASATVSVAVGDLPTVTIKSNSPLTLGQTLNLSATGGGTYTWAGVSGFSSTLRNPSKLNVNASSSGVYTVSVVSASGCVVSATTSVTVNSACNVAINPSSNKICAGATIQLSANGQNVANYAWAGPSNFSSTLQNPTRNTATAAMSGVYSLTVTGTQANTCTNTATVSVSVGTVSATISSNSPLKVGQTVTLLSTGGGTYAWQGPSNFSSTLQNPTIASATAAMSGVYNLTVISTSGCSITLSTSVDIQPTCNVSVTANAGTACIGSSFQLSADAVGATSYAWKGPSNFSSTLQNPTRDNIGVTFGGIYSVTVVGSTGSTCTASAVTSPVAINAVPIAKALANTPINTGDAISLTATGGGTYLWKGPFGFTSTLDKPVILSANDNMIGDYTVTVGFSTGCSSTAKVSINLNGANNGCIKPDAGIDKKLCRPSTTIMLKSAAADQEWVLPLRNPASAKIDASTGEVTGMTKNGTYRFILRIKNSPQCADTVAVKIGILDVLDNAVCSPTTTYILPAATGTARWTALATNPFAATITTAGQVANMQELGTYRFVLDNGTCKDTVAIVKSNCSLPIDLAIKKSVNKTIVAVGDEVIYTIKLWNDGPGVATGIEVKDVLPNTLELVSSMASAGNYSLTTRLWKVAKLNPKDTVTLKMIVKVLAEGISYNAVEVCKANEEDLDSTPCNNQPKEDDYDQICVSVPYKICDSEKITARLQDGLTNIQWFKDGVTISGATKSGLEISTAGDYTYTATLVDCPVSGCCPIRVIMIDCCKPDSCVPFVVVPSLMNKPK